jgi:creatinine amidohydrolase
MTKSRTSISFSEASEVQIQHMTWPEVQQALRDGKRTAIIVAAASEQHGPHLPVGTDEMLGEAQAIRIARRLGDALVAPVIRPGWSDEHMEFPGTITIKPDVLIALLESYVESLRRHGFTRFLVFSSHGSNYPVFIEWQRGGLPAGVVLIGDLDGLIGTIRRVLQRFGRDDETIPHAEVAETSELLYVRPELVHLDRVERGFVGGADLDELLSGGVRAVSETGILGDARGATQKMGEAIMEEVVDYFVQAARAEK